MEQINPLQLSKNSLVRRQCSSLNPSLSPCLSSRNRPRRLGERYSRRQSKVLAAKSMTELLPALRHSLGGSDGRVVFPSRWQSLSRCRPQQARLRKTCYHSCNTDFQRKFSRGFACTYMHSNARFDFLFQYFRSYSIRIIVRIFASLNKYVLLSYYFVHIDSIVRFQ